MPNQPTIIIILLVLLSVLSIFIFPNTMYYALILLSVVFLTLSFLFFNNLISSLTILILLIVYVGAIMILVGYVCAVCPNLNLSPSTHIILPSLLFLTFVFSLLPSFYSTPSSIFVSNLSFLFSPSGFLLFITLVFILFIILLIVTSYYVSPNGPFRSLT